MFTSQTSQLLTNPSQLNYGIAVTDVDGDGRFEIFVAGFGFPNLILKWNGSGYEDIASSKLADATRYAIGVAAGDLDGDGREEIYVLNTDTFAGPKRFGDRLFDFRDGDWVDFFELPQSEQLTNLTAGRSVICVDRNGDGWYGFLIANYGGPMSLFELNDDGQLVDVGPEVGLNYVTGGRGLIALPLISQGMDIFAANEGGPNFLFRNRGDGAFEEVAEQWGLLDAYQHGRGIAALDADGDGKFDLVYGNWEGRHRLCLQRAAEFEDVAPLEMALPSLIRTVIAADFDNDGYEEIFFNNIGQPNRLFGFRDGVWRLLDIGEAREASGLGTGAAVGDFDGDGQLELIIAHGESSPQPLSFYRPTYPVETHNAWLRVLPLTEQGAPARGAVVRLIQPERNQLRAIDAGSGYLCQMEPVAHFGLGSTPDILRVEIRWPDGATVTLEAPEANQLIRVDYPNRFLL